MNNPKVSIIVPCYNQAGYLTEALGSVLGQTFADWECIIVNDGSTDNTADVAREWLKKDARFRYVEKPNGGLSSARNAGIKSGVGEFIHFLDADDFMLPGFYEPTINQLLGKPEAAAAFSGWTFVDAAGKVQKTGEVESGDKDWFHFMLERCLCPCHALVFRKKMFERFGNFDETLRSCEDWDMWLRIAASGAEFVRVPGYYACYRQHGQSMTMNHQRMLNHGYGVIRRNAQRHGNCKKCRESSRLGLKNFSFYVWNLTQRQQMRDLLAQGRFGAYIARTIRQNADDPLWLKWNLMTLIRSKRLVASALLRPLGIQIAQRRSSQ
jgi:glycosyltransferase involved in cell wall biosynthesis